MSTSDASPAVPGIFDHIPEIAQAQPATDHCHELAEGPIWDPSSGLLRWVNILAGEVLSGELATDGSIRIVERLRFPDTAGTVAVTDTGELLVAGAHRLLRRTPNGEVIAGEDLISGDDRRFNDGKPDPAGRFLVGTKGPGPEVLLLVEDGRARTIDDDLSLSNGLTWSSDGCTLYSIDTPSGRIFSRDYDPKTGQTGVRQVFLTLEGAFPDGMTTDADDHLWVAVWGAGCVLRISPAGDIVGRVTVPAPNTSCPAFAGPGLDTLVITTATEGMTGEELVKHPLSGRLFTARTGIIGSAPRLWNPKLTWRRSADT